MLLANHPNGISDSDFLDQEDMDAFDRAAQEDLDAVARPESE